MPNDKVEDSYRISYSDSLQGLTQAVNAQAKDGFSPIGGVAMGQVPARTVAGFMTMFIQAVVKNDTRVEVQGDNLMLT